jgi:hypothetical protein
MPLAVRDNALVGARVAFAAVLVGLFSPVRRLSLLWQRWLRTRSERHRLVDYGGTAI